MIPKLLFPNLLDILIKPSALLFFIILQFNAYSQESPFIRKLKKETVEKHLNNNSFWNSINVKGTPVIERSESGFYFVTFLWRESHTLNVHNVVVVTELNSNNFYKNQMMKIPGTDIWYKCYKLPGATKLTYSIGYNDPLTPVWESQNMQQRTTLWKQDSLNRKFVDFGFYKVSLLELPLAKKIQTTGTEPRGTENEMVINSQFLNRQKKINIYYYPGTSHTKLLVLLDGDQYDRFSDLKTGIDKLIKDEIIPPLTIAYVQTGYPNRDQELSCNDNFGSFIIKELIPKLEKEYSLDQSDIAISGSSMGGLTATYLGFLHPDIFKNVIAQSSSYQWKPDSSQMKNWLIHEIELKNKRPVRFILTVGKIETEQRNAISQLEANEQMYKALYRKKYDVKLFKYDGGHDYQYWQYYLINGLKQIYKSNKKEKINK
jgi:enterochelin esterase-like enzyme